MRIAIVSGILFLSGVSALIFEVLWLRLSGLAFGNSVWAAALILSSFMAGLALGSLIASRLRLQRRRPLQVYAGLELIVALLGCTIVFGIPLLGQWMRPVFQALWNHDAAMNALRLMISFLILLVPTTAMGLTLPVVLEDPGLRRHHFGRVIGLLYGCNTLGAVIGALAGEAYLVKAFGLYGTALAAGILNCTAGLIAFALARRNAEPVAKDDRDSLGEPLQNAAGPRWRLLAVSFGTGFALLCLELVWFRFLRLYIASSSTAFAIMLAVVLAGIGCGGVAFGAIRRRGAQQDWLPGLLAATGLMTLLCYIFFPVALLPKTDFYLETWQEIVSLSFALMFPVAFLSGILFPLVVSRIQSETGNRMNSAGLATLFNTAGAAAGPLLGGFVFLPLIGFQWSLVLCASIYLALAAIASQRGSWSVRTRPGLTFVVLLVASAVVFSCFPHDRADAHFAHARKPFEADGSSLIEKIEGTSDTLQLLRRDLLAKPYYYRLLTNAFTMSDTRYQNQRYMRLFAYLPLTLRPEAREALLLCYGCGMTADALVRDRGLQHIDIVDISREVFRLAEQYTGADYANPLRDSRVTCFVQDGRFFLQASPRQYDVITGEPPPPKVAGTVNLYTEEFFHLMHARLKDGGIATFWLPINQLKAEESKAILRAFHNAFPNASVWANADYEWIMMGIKGSPRKLAPEESRRLWSDQKTRADLEKIGIEAPEQLPALLLMDRAGIDSLTSETKPLSDFYPKRLSDSPADLEETDALAAGYMDASSAARQFRASPLMATVWPELPQTALDPYFVLRETRYVSEFKGSNKLAELDFYLRGLTLRAPVLELLQTDPMRVSIVENAAGDAQSLPPDTRPDLVAGALARRDYGRAIALLEAGQAQTFARRSDLLLLIYLYCLNGNVDKAEALAPEIGSEPKDGTVRWLFGKMQAEFGFRPPR